jgi:hypothetical protein
MDLPNSQEKRLQIKLALRKMIAIRQAAASISNS